MDKVDRAIEHLKMADYIAQSHTGQPMMIAYSGGKDSDVCVKLAEMSGLPFEAVHSHTSVDAPETVYHVRNVFCRLEDKGVKCTIEYPIHKGKRATMWNLIRDKKILPTRLMRYCCSVLKETSGEGRAVVSGVRRAESIKRSARGHFETIEPDIDKRVILNNAEVLDT